MSTKNDPGKYDCYAKLAPDEPYFLLRAKDPTGSHLVAAWTCIRAGDFQGALKALLRADEAWTREILEGRRTLLPYAAEKSMEAQQCAQAMLTWFQSKRLGEMEERLKGAVRCVRCRKQGLPFSEGWSRECYGENDYWTCPGCMDAIAAEHPLRNEKLKRLAAKNKPPHETGS